MPKQQITQAELQAVLELNASVNREMLKLRKRLQAGAKVEPGKWSARHDPEPEDYDPFAPGLYCMGLDISATGSGLEHVHA